MNDLVGEHGGYGHGIPYHHCPSIKIQNEFLEKATSEKLSQKKCQKHKWQF